MLNNIIKFIDWIGYLGPQILFFTSLSLLYKKSTLFSGYVIGNIINILLNFILKGIFRQPRPTEDSHIFNAYVANGKRLGYDKFGMPSGHAQTAFFSTTFMYFALNNTNNTIVAIYLLISFITAYQRIKYKNHTVTQVIVGSIIGTILGFYFYNQSVNKITGLLNFKTDDDGPI